MVLSSRPRWGRGGSQRCLDLVHTARGVEPGSALRSFSFGSRGPCRRPPLCLNGASQCAKPSLSRFSLESCAVVPDLWLRSMGSDSSPGGRMGRRRGCPGFPKSAPWPGWSPTTEEPTGARRCGQHSVAAPPRPSFSVYMRCSNYDVLF